MKNKIFKIIRILKPIDIIFVKKIYQVFFVNIFTIVVKSVQIKYCFNKIEKTPRFLLLTFLM